MFNFGILLAVLLLGITNLTCATNYCDPSLCNFDNQIRNHIGCNNNGEFSPECENPELVIMTPELKQTILYTHNDLRNLVANGSLPGFESAKRMTTLTWDIDLAYLAGLNTLRCELHRDECHNTPAYKYSGQNLAIQYISNPFLLNDYDSIIVDMIYEWFSTNERTFQEEADRCCGTVIGTGLFLQIIQDKSSKVGCGLIKFSGDYQGKKMNTVLMACNYSFSNLIDWPVYAKGPMCSGCETGCNPEFSGLCSIAEVVPPVPSEGDSSENKTNTQIDTPIPLDTSIEYDDDQKPQVGLQNPQIEISPRVASDESLVSQDQDTSDETDCVEIKRSFLPEACRLDATVPCGPLSFPIVTPRPLSSKRFSRPGDPEQLRPIMKRLMAYIPQGPASAVRPTPAPRTIHTRQAPGSRFKELFGPLRPVPRPVVLVGEALQTVASFFIMP